MSFAYSRDPSLVFVERGDGFAPPLNYENSFFNGKQPVRYEKEILKTSLGDKWQVGEMASVVDIHWINGSVRAFDNVEEAMNNINVFALDDFRMHCLPETVDAYIVETVSFLKRGHSLMHPHCTCRHEISKKRCMDLGILHIYSEFNKRRCEIPCILPRHPREFSPKEVSDELAISDVVLFDIDGIRLLPILNKHCRLRINDKKLFFSFKTFIFGPLDNREDLVNALASQPLTLTVDHSMYKGILHDIEEMVKEGRVLVMKRDNDDVNSTTLFYLNPRWELDPIDSDVIALWHSIDVKGILCMQQIRSEPKEKPLKKISKRKMKIQTFIAKHKA
jgi:hypothetical protein